MKRHILVTTCLISLAAAGRVVAADATNPAPEFDPAGAVRAISRTNNIFDPNRYPFRPQNDQPPRIRQAPSETFTLVGTWKSAQGTFAIFDGNTSQYRKTAKPSDVIAGYKIAEISHDFVKLAASSNQTINLPVGTQMRRSQGGPWSVGGRYEATAEPAPAPEERSAPASESPTSAPPSGAVSDIVRRMMERKAQEK